MARRAAQSVGSSAARLLLLTLLLLDPLTGVAAPDESQAPGKSQAPDEPQLTVMSYNIHHGEGVDGRLDLPRIARVIAQADPDLVALQEVDRGTQRSQQVDQIAELSRLTGMHFAFSQAISYQGGQYGNAVLSRYPLRLEKDLQLPNTLEGEQRTALVVHVAWPAGDTAGILFCSTHWDHGRQPRDRELSAQALVDLARSYSDQRLILAGDLNAELGSSALDRLLREWTPSSPQPHPTTPVDQPRRQIDFVLYYPPHRWQSLATEVLDQPIASDHLPIVARLRLSGLPAAEPPSAGR